MRILVVTQYFWPENFRINDLVSEFTLRGHDVTVLTGYPNYPGGTLFPEFAADASAFREYKGVRVIRVPMAVRGQGRLRLLLNYVSFALSASIFGIWKTRKMDFDVIFSYEPSPITVAIPAIVVRSIKRVPLVLWVLDLWPETLQAVGVVRSPALLRVVGRIVAFIYRRCDLILAQSRSFIPQIKKYAAGHGRIEYFPSWAESVFALGEVTAATEVQKSEAFNVMFAGNIGEAQDFPMILAAAERLKGHAKVRWLIVGDGRKADWVRCEILRLGLERSVMMVGSYPVERMPSFYEHADALLVSLKDDPIFSMTIPGKLQSYFAAGRPVIAVLNGEGADVVRNAGAGVAVPAGDSKGLADAVLRLQALPAEELAAMGRNSRALSVNEFNREKLISQLEQRLVTICHRSEVAPLIRTGL